MSLSVKRENFGLWVNNRKSTGDRLYTVDYLLIVCLKSLERLMTWFASFERDSSISRFCSSPIHFRSNNIYYHLENFVALQSVSYSSVIRPYYGYRRQDKGKCSFNMSLKHTRELSLLHFLRLERR